MRGLAIAALALGAAAASAEAAEPTPRPVPGYPGVAIFDMPDLTMAEALARRAVALGRYDEANRLLTPLLARSPGAPSLLALAAAAAAGQRKDSLALDRLEAAVAAGYGDLFGLLARPPLNRLANHERVANLPESEAGPPPLPPRARNVRAGEALVDAENAGWAHATGDIVAYFAFPKSVRRRPLFHSPAGGALAKLVDWVKRGKAAGNAGDLYDNRDSGHSTIKRAAKQPTQLSHVIYGEAAKKARLHYGLNRAVRFNAPTFGNSSTALSGPQWRSQTRDALTSPGGPNRLWSLFADNHIYVYPANKDFVSEKNGWRGDVFPAYQPYVFTSLGASGSDRPILRAVRAILAAFKPKTKAFLVERRLIGPTVQRILRGSLTGADGRNGYLSASAHPTVIDGPRIDLGRAITAAQALKAGDVPPVVRIRMLQEAVLRSGVSYFADGLSERLFDTPGAIARLWRGVEPTRRYVIQAEAKDPNSREVTFHWRVLRGAPDAVRIRPVGPDSAVAEVTVGWQPRQPDLDHPEVLSHRVDVAVFADNGVELSTPAIFSVAFPSHQTRVYGKGGTGQRIESVDYMEGPSRYADPRLWPIREWRDVYRYAADGALLGWTRARRGGKTTEFRADGRRADGTAVAYPGERRPKDARKAHLFIVETPRPK